MLITFLGLKGYVHNIMKIEILIRHCRFDQTQGHFLGLNESFEPYDSAC